jgi:hypothetical protein
MYITKRVGRMYVCVYVRMYVCMYVCTAKRVVCMCMYVCMYVIRYFKHAGLLLQGWDSLSAAPYPCALDQQLRCV